MEIQHIRTPLPPTKRGEMLLVKDPSNSGAPMSVPVGTPAQSEAPALTSSVPAAAAPISAASASSPAAAVDVLGNPLPEPTREEQFTIALRNFVTAFERMTSTETFQNILKTASANGVSMDASHPNVGKELAAAKKLL